MAGIQSVVESMFACALGMRFCWRVGEVDPLAHHTISHTVCEGDGGGRHRCYFYSDRIGFVHVGALMQSCTLRSVMVASKDFSKMIGVGVAEVLKSSCCPNSFTISALKL